MDENIRDEYINENTVEDDNTPLRRLLPACQVIAKILTHKKMDVIEQFGLNEEHIWDPQYKELYIFIKNHYSKYGTVPDTETLLREEHFHSVIDTVTFQVNEPDAYLRDQLWEDYMFHKTAKVLQQAASLTEVDAAEGVNYLNTQMSLLNQEMKPGGMDIIQQAKERLEAYDKRRSVDNYYIPTGFAQLDDKICGWAPGEELVVLVARTGVGKEQPLYSKVLTPLGWKTMGDINTGDAVISGTGNICKVLEVFPQGVKPVYRIYLDDGTYVDAGLQHLWTVQSKSDRLSHCKRSDDYRVVTTEEMMKSLDNDWTIDLVSPISFPYCMYRDEVDAYLLGVLFSDMTAKVNRNITITINNTTVLHKLKRIVKRYDCKLRRVKENSYCIQSSKLFNTNNNLVQLLIKNGFVTNGEFTGVLPYEFLTASGYLKMQFIAGVMDNNALLSDNVFTLDINSRLLSHDLKELLGSLGIWHSVLRKSSSEGEYDQFTIKLNVNMLNASHLLTSWRKPSSYKRHVVNVEYLKDEECKCIMVDDITHTYITDNYTITHNTWVMTKMLTESWRNGLNVGLLEPEMTGVKIGYRFDAIFKGFSNRKLSYARDLESDYDRYCSYIEELSNKTTKFCVAHPKDFGGTVTVSKLKQWCITNDVKILGIDGISYIKDERGKPSDNTTTALTNISADLMELSIELGIPVIIVVQSNRGSLETGGKPTLETIRDSDGIAYSASMVFSLYVKHDALHLSLLKNRNGDSNITLAYDWDVDVGKFEFLQEGEVDGDEDESVSSGNTHSYSNSRSDNDTIRPDRSAGYMPAGMDSSQVQDYERHEATGADVF